MNPHSIEDTVSISKPISRLQRSRIRSVTGVPWSSIKETCTGLLFLAPSLAVFAVFCFYPLLRSLYLSMQITNPRGKVVSYAGWDNFKELLHSEVFLQNLGVTGTFALYTVPSCILLALLLAVLTSGAGRGMKWFQRIYSLPIAISVGTGAVIWNLLFHPTAGMFNYALKGLGMKPIGWLTDPSWALGSVSLMTVWMNLGFAFIVLLSGIQAIPSEMHESAKMDGAGPWVQLTRITLPLLSPTLFFLLVVSVIQSLQAFGQFNIMTKGGPTHSTDVIVFGIYREAFVNYRFGIASAQALVLFLLIIVLTVIQFAVVERKVHYR